MSTPAPVHTRPHTTARPDTTARRTRTRPARRTEARVAPGHGTSGHPDAPGAGR